MFLEQSTKRNFLIWLLIIIPGAATLSSHIATMYRGTDFPVYYITATRMIDPQFTIEEIYQIAVQDDTLPERNLQGNNFIYSPVIATLLSPLGFLSYSTAKSTLIFLNIIAYCAAIALILKQIGRHTWALFLISMLFIGMPFFRNICLAQVNSFILLLIVGAIYLASLSRYGVAGGLLSLAAMFKIFPLGIALFLGSYDRRITLICFTLFAVALTAPGTLPWVQSMPTVSAGHTPIYIFAKQHGIGWLLLYFSGTALLSIYCLFKAKTNDLLTLSSYSIPAALVIMPVIQDHHLVVLAVTYIIIFYSTSSLITSRSQKMCLLLVALNINLNFFWKFLPGSYWSILVIWIIMSWALLTKLQASNTKVSCDNVTKLNHPDII